MLKEFVWRAFEKTGDIDMYMFYRQIEEQNKLFSEKPDAGEEVAISS